jgi:hemolysin activation/secretion protein
MLVHGGRLKAATGLAVLLCCAAASAQQTAPQPGQDRPLPEAGPPPDLDFTIQAPRRSPVPRAVEELTFDVKDVRVTGATRYGNDVLRPMVQPVIGQTVHLADLITIAEQIEARYHQDGYVLTRVFVPTQSVNDGTFQITVIEGYIAAVAVQGGDDGTRERVEKMVAPLTRERPLQVSSLETALLSANKLPGVSASGLLRPSATEPGASELVVTVKETPVYGGLAADNMGATNTGRWTISGDATAPSPIGDGGQISLNASVDPASYSERHALSGKYTAPLPLLDGMTYSITGLTSHGEPGGTVSSLTLITDSTAFGARVGLPLIVRRAEELSLDAGLTVQSGDVKALGSALTHDEWRVADIAVTYANNVWADGVTNATLDVAQGIPSLGASASGTATLSRGGGSTDFTKFTGLVRRVQAISGPLTAALTVNGQYALNTLLTGEEVSFGGQMIGRGYDPGAITGDMGAGAALEMRYDLKASWFYADAAQLFAFADGATVRNHSGGIDHDQIASTGGGIRVTIPGNVVLGLMYGHALIGVPGNDEGKRTSRVMFNTAVRF